MNEQPVFMQIMEIIEADIMTDVYTQDDLIISTTQIAKLYSVNPNTAVKAITKLTDAGVLYKRRGIGMCVAPGAKAQIMERRRQAFLGETLQGVVTEARVLGMTRDELLDAIKAADSAAPEKGKQQ